MGEGLKGVELYKIPKHFNFNEASVDTYLGQNSIASFLIHNSYLQFTVHICMYRIYREDCDMIKRNEPYDRY